MLKWILSALFLVGAAVPAMAANEVIPLLPMSNELDTPVVVSTGTNPSVIVVSSTTITRLDGTAAADLLTAMGATYKRAEITVQNTGSSWLYISYRSGGWTTATAGFKLAVGDVWTFSVGKGVYLYGLSDATYAGEARVGALAWR